MKKLIYCAVFYSVFMNSLAIDGNDYVGFCKTYLEVYGDGETVSGKPEDFLAAGVCMGYTRGVLEALDSLQKIAFVPQFFCIPAEAPDNQLYRVALKYLEDNPAELHGSANELLVVAFGKAFPCEPK